MCRPDETAAGEFDRILDRTRRSSVKYDFGAKYGVAEDAIPMWVADMDFCAPPQVVHTLEAVARDGCYGYTYTSTEYIATLGSWFHDRFGWDIPEHGLVQAPSVMFGIVSVMRATTREGDAVLIQEPVYEPFHQAVVWNRRKLVVNELVHTDGEYSIDFDELERLVEKNGVKLFILCSPHNPTGRVWREDELRRIGDVMLRHGVRIVSDEIHADLVYPGHRHTVFASLSDELANNCVVCTSATKTFNLPGLHVANLFVPNRKLWSQVDGQVQSCFYEGASLPALAASQAAYKYGGPWKDRLLTCLEANARYVRDELAVWGRGIKTRVPEATYLLWLDCRALGMTDGELDAFWGRRARVWLSSGHSFGKGGSGFMRMNIAAPRATVQEALRRVKSALETFGQIGQD